MRILNFENNQTNKLTQTIIWTKAQHKHYKKLSYRRETARQLHTSFSAHSLIVLALH